MTIHVPLSDDLETVCRAVYRELCAAGWLNQASEAVALRDQYHDVQLYTLKLVEVYGLTFDWQAA